ncbi:MAG: biotin/lipoyl-binding protein, partial [Clostridia bacterium]|nr:biotin/lipoyl-binding protein [Clostridia bacterium]
MAKRKSAVFILTGSLLIAGILLFWPVEKGVKVDTAVVGGGQLVQTVMLRGTVQYAQQEPCITLKDGVIADVYAKAGDRVREGELLFRLDTTAEEKALAAL